jgi:hypothetical protein
MGTEQHWCAYATAVYTLRAMVSGCKNPSLSFMSDENSERSRADKKMNTRLR